MTEVRKSAVVVGEKRGFPLYATNPSIPDEAEIKKQRRARIGDDVRGLLVDHESGEILGHGGAIAYEWEEVDKERFVKLYLAGLKRAAGLSKSGLAVFEIVYNQVRANPGKDTVMLSALSSGLEERTYQRGLRELLQREFLFRTLYEGAFFVNIRFMFNGDRLAFVKGYRLRQDQPELPLGPPAPPASLPSRGTGGAE